MRMFHDGGWVDFNGNVNTLYIWIQQWELGVLTTTWILEYITCF
jgi:hypothetical protein